LIDFDKQKQIKGSSMFLFLAGLVRSLDTNTRRLKFKFRTEEEKRKKKKKKKITIARDNGTIQQR
jgi:hypothetical protein